MTVPTSLWGETRKRRPPYTGPLAVVHVPADTCPRCTAPTVTDAVEVDALFRHGGHGATLRTTRRCCTRCTWGITVEVTETRPPR